MDEELPGWPQTEGCGQWLNVHVEVGDEWYPVGLISREAL